MDRIDAERSLLSESDTFSSKNWRMIRMIAVVRAKCFKVTLVGQLRHCRREKVRVYITLTLLQS